MLGLKGVFFQLLVDHVDACFVLRVFVGLPGLLEFVEVVLQVVAVAAVARGILALVGRQVMSKNLVGAHGLGCGQAH